MRGKQQTHNLHERGKRAAFTNSLVLLIECFYRKYFFKRERFVLPVGRPVALHTTTADLSDSNENLEVFNRLVRWNEGSLKENQGAVAFEVIFYHGWQEYSDANYFVIKGGQDGLSLFAKGMQMELKSKIAFFASLFCCLRMESSAFALKRGVGLGISQVSSDSRLNDISNLYSLFDEVVYTDSWFGIAHSIRFDFSNGVSGRNENAEIKSGRLRAFHGTLGLQVSQQTGFFQPYAGAGVLIGGVGISGAKPLRSGNSLLEPGETGFSYGFYAEGAFDFMFNDSVGLRIGSKYTSIQTRPLGSVGGSVKLNFFTPYAAVAFTFRGCNPVWFLYLVGIGPQGTCNQ